MISCALLYRKEGGFASECFYVSHRTGTNTVFNVVHLEDTYSMAREGGGGVQGARWVSALNREMFPEK